MSELLPPLHKVMDSALECHLANDCIAKLEAELGRIGESWRNAGERIVILETKIKLLEALAYTVPPGGNGGITVRDVLRHVESEFADFKEHHQGGGCGTGQARHERITS